MKLITFENYYNDDPNRYDKLKFHVRDLYKIIGDIQWEPFDNGYGDVLPLQSEFKKAAEHVGLPSTQSWNDVEFLPEESIKYLSDVILHIIVKYNLDKRIVDQRYRNELIRCLNKLQVHLSSKLRDTNIKTGMLENINNNMKHIKTFESFNTDEILQVSTPEEFKDALNMVNPKIMTSDWKYDKMMSMQLDSSKQRAWVDSSVTNGNFAMAIQHDDYDGGNWGVSLINPNGETGDELIVNIDNLDFYTSWRLFADVVGDEAILNINGDWVPFNTFIKEHPEYGNAKLKRSIDLGIMDSPEVNAMDSSF